ncbi:hypothetical protein B7494_g8352 [Chlorociboria aeruginascens]|nr:hypothetical protein B7494_g8352 [Chlorociboria aeruginascens]
MLASLEKHDSGSAEPSQKKRCRALDAELPANSKRQQFVEAIDALQRTQLTDKQQYLEDWLTASSWSRSWKQRRSDQQPVEQPYQGPDIMPRPPSFPIDTAATSSAKTAKTSASVRDPDYRSSLANHNIYIEKEHPPSELMRRAQNIISHPRQSPPIDDDVIAGIRENIRNNMDKGEEAVKLHIAASIIPGFSTVPNAKLQQSHGQLWYKSVPIPLDPDFALGPALVPLPLPLPKPKPDLAFGYSEGAFSPSELRTIQRLVEGSSGKSFASPDTVLLFPFFILEFKSQVEEGSLYTARNQAAGAGAIAMNGILELWSRSFGLDSFDFDEPRVFSLIMDQDVLSLNVHWIGARSDTDQFSYNLEEVSMYLLKYGTGIQDLENAIKNIFDHFTNKALKDIHTGLAEYRKKIIAYREAEAVESTQDGVESRVPHKGLGGNKTPQPPRKKIIAHRKAEAVESTQDGVKPRVPHKGLGGNKTPQPPRKKIIAHRKAEAVESTQDGVESHMLHKELGGNKTPQPPSKKVKPKAAAAGKKGHVAHKVEKETYGRRQTRASTQKEQKQVDV